LAPIFRSEEGELRVPAGQRGDAVVRWRPLPVLTGTVFDPIELSDADFAALRSEGDGAFGSGWAMRSQPTGDPETVERLVFRSLKNTLQRKRLQARLVSDPYVLVVRSGHDRVPPEALLDLLERRVWPNARYRWITAGAVLFPRLTYNAGDPEARLVTSVNENATLQASVSLRGLLSGERGFHLHEGQFFESLSEVRNLRAGKQAKDAGT
jgi:hypothetical protein